ncbi:MAG: hypothetical protein WBO34_01870 [Gammaproteobacteria bacterium]
MNAKTITSALIAAVLGFYLGLPGMVLAGDRQYDRHGSGHSGGHRYKQDRHHKRNKKRQYGYNRHHNKGYNNRPYYRHRGYGGNYYYYDDDDDYDELLFGLVTGGILGYALNQSQQEQRYVNLPPPDAYSHSGSCLQQREYQTTVIVGGRSVDAYGTACLQPDGSWTRSPARVAPY